MITATMLFVNITISEAIMPNSNALIMVSATIKIPAPENACEACTAAKNTEDKMTVCLIVKQVLNLFSMIPLK